MTGWWTRFGSYVIWPLRVVLCMKTGGLLGLFHCTRLKEREVTVVIYRSDSLLNVVGKIYAGILLGRVRRVTGGLIDDEQGGGCVDQIFTLKQIGEKNIRVYVGIMDLEKAYDSFNRDALW